MSLKNCGFICNAILFTCMYTYMHTDQLAMKKLLQIMEECISKRVLPPHWHDLSLVNKSTVQAIQCRDTLFRSAKKSGKHQDHACFSTLYCQSQPPPQAQSIKPQAVFWRLFNSSIRNLLIFQLSLMMKICMTLTWVRRIIFWTHFSPAVQMS